MKTPFVKDFMHEFLFQSQRSRGPGGQHVNKTNSSSQLRWNFESSLILTDEQKNIIYKKLSSIINAEGFLYLRSDTHRDLESNKKEVLKKLQEHLVKAFFKPKPRKATKPTRSSQEKRINSKKLKSDIKKSRQGKWY